VTTVPPLLRRLLLAVFGLGALGLIVYAFLPQPVEVDVADVTRGSLRVTVEDDGRTRVKEKYVVSAPLAGQLLRVTLDPGDAVDAGKTVVAALEPTDPALLDPRARAEAEGKVSAAVAAKDRAEAELRRARAEADFARSEVGRIRRLAQTGAASVQEVESAENRERTTAEALRGAQFGVQIAAFELDIARAALKRTRPASPGEEVERFEIRSPIGGKVLRVFQESAAVLTPGTRLLELGDPADLEAEIDVLSTEAVKVRPGAKVELVHWGGTEALPGRVRLVEPAAFTKVSALGVEEQRVNVIVDFVGPPEQRRALGDGYRVEARIVIWEQDGLLKIPSGAIFRHDGGWAVYRVEDGRARLRPIEVGQNNGLEVQVLAGLDEGDRVLVHPSDRIKDGVAVAPR
jgi:HlyD family secretion protein